MQRRLVRLKKEYIYRKSLEGDERKVYEQKRLIREALQGLVMIFFFSIC